MILAPPRSNKEGVSQLHLNPPLSTLFNKILLKTHTIFILFKADCFDKTFGTKIVNLFV